METSLHKNTPTLWRYSAQTKSRIRRHTAVILFFIFLSFPCFSQTPNQQQITASYLYNFAKNIDWPQQADSETFNILLFRVDDSELYNALLYLKKNVKLHGKPISISRGNSTKSLNKFQLIFTMETKSVVIDNIYNRIDGRPTLLVTWQFDNKQLVMINLKPTEDRLLKFEVNKSNIINQGLKPHPEIILNGGTEIDVAKLYREGQASLVRLKKQLDAREAVLVELAGKISKQEVYNSNLEKQLSELSHNIQQSKTLIEEQSSQLESQRKEIDIGIKLQKNLEVEVEKRSKALLESQEILTKIQEKISSRENKLTTLNNRISAQETEIETQKGTIVELDEVVSTQKRALSYLQIMVILAILLILSIFMAYKTKRKDNARLRAKGQDLQMATNRLSIAKHKAEEANQAKGEFLSLMSHELRTPLQSIIGYTDVIMEELKTEGEQTHVDDLQRVINNSERLLRLINGVLDLAKNESGNMTLVLIETRLSTLIEEALDSLRPQIERSHNKLVTEIKETKKLAIVDPEKLLQIVINLLSNAAKFCENGKITLKVVHDPNRILIRVTDTGIGMDVEQQSHIFEKFCQADSSTTRKFQGSGLGLTITRQFCELMGGSIQVESQRNAGASFVVNIPLPIETDAIQEEKVNQKAVEL